MSSPKDLVEVQQLINMGKKRGYVTYEEMNNVLPTHLVASDRLDDVMILFSDMDIEVVNEQRKRREQERRGGNQDKEKAPEVTRSNDPVRVYLRKMGSVSLLSREGEIEIAKRIEEGEITVKQVVLTSPVAAEFIKELVDEDEARVQKAIRSGKKPRRTKTSEGLSLEEAYEKARQLNHQYQLVLDELTKVKAKKRKQELEAQADDVREALYMHLDTLELSKRQIAEISFRMQDAWTKIAKCEKEVEKVARDARLPVRDLRRSIRQVRRNFDMTGRDVVKKTGIKDDK